MHRPQSSFSFIFSIVYNASDPSYLEITKVDLLQPECSTEAFAEDGFLNTGKCGLQATEASSPCVGHKEWNAS